MRRAHHTKQEGIKTYRRHLDQITGKSTNRCAALALARSPSLDQQVVALALTPLPLTPTPNPNLYLYP